MVGNVNVAIDFKDAFNKLGDQFVIAITLDQLGLLYKTTNKLNSPKEHLEKALQIFRRLGAKPYITQTEKHLQRILTKTQQTQQK